MAILSKKPGHEEGKDFMPGALHLLRCRSMAASALFGLDAFRPAPGRHFRMHRAMEITGVGVAHGFLEGFHVLLPRGLPSLSPPVAGPACRRRSGRMPSGWAPPWDENPRTHKPWSPDGRPCFPLAPDRRS